MVINFVAPHLKIAGGTRIILTYANLLAKRGHKVFVYVTIRDFFKRTVFNFIKKKPRWIDNFQPKVIWVPDFRERFVKRGDATIVTSVKAASYVNNYSSKAGKKFYIIQHDERLYHSSREEADKTYKMPFEQIVVSSWLREIMKEKFGKEAHLLLNPIDREQFKPLGRTFDKVSIRILLLDHDYEWKGTKEGVEIVNELKEKYQNAKLILFGARRKEPPYKYDEYYYNLPQNKLAWLYSNSDIYLCPSWDEGSGLPSMEAMACKCALVTYDNGGSRDYAFDGKTAMVAERRNVEMLKAKLEELIRNPELRKKIAEDGYRQIMSMPTWEEQTTKLEKILQNA